jgi:hypothetical protein
MNYQISNRKIKISPVLALSIVLFFSLSPMLFGQEPPPRPITITVSPQGLSFGAFTHGAIGGSVIIAPDGSRTSTGDVFLLNFGYSYSAAFYEIDANPGTIINILNGPDAVLTRAGGGTMTLHVGTSFPAAPFVTTAIPPAKTSFYMGATLTVGGPASNPPGSYSGTFNIIFIQE